MGFVEEILKFHRWECYGKPGARLKKVVFFFDKSKVMAAGAIKLRFPLTCEAAPSVHPQTSCPVLAARWSWSVMRQPWWSRSVRPVEITP